MSTKIEKELRVFDSAAEAEHFDLQQLSSLSGSERIANALLMMMPYYETSPRLERVYRVVQLKELPISDGWRVGL